MTALLRYLAADVLRSQRWAAPLLAYLVAVAIISPSNRSPLVPTLTMSAAALLPVALWLAVVVNHSEDPVQAHITGVTIGSATRLRLAKLGTAYLACLVLAAAAIGWVVSESADRITGSALAVGAVEHLTTALTGIALGALISRPVLTRAGWTVLAGVGICLAPVLVPGVPPTHPLLLTFGEHPPADPWAPLLTTAGESVLLAGAAIVLAHLVARART
jgi:hypothetical protein